MGQLFTIGHSTNEAAHLLENLKRHQVDFVLDVRSMPYSKYASQYNKEAIQAFLKNHGIAYYHMAKYFGARLPDRSLYHPEGYLDFEKVRASYLFQKGMENVQKGLESGHNIALMCTEKRPIDCHRAIMVARGFELVGIKAMHILNDGSLMTQDALNEELLNRYFKNRDQLSLELDFDNHDTSDELTEAYRRRNKEIGYRLGEEEKILE